MSYSQEQLDVTGAVDMNSSAALQSRNEKSVLYSLKIIEWLSF
jgi:hypothetical protein